MYFLLACCAVRFYTIIETDFLQPFQPFMRLFHYRYREIENNVKEILASLCREAFRGPDSRIGKRYDVIQLRNA